MTLNSSSVDVRLAFEQDRRTLLNMLLSLFGSDLDLSLAGVRQSNRYLSYYRMNASGGLSVLICDPKKAAAARIYDLEGDGFPDFLNLKVVDGGYGSKNGVVNGLIDDPSTAASVDLFPVLTTLDAHIMMAGDPSKPITPVSLRLRDALQGCTASADQIRYVVFDLTESTTLTLSAFNFILWL